MKWSTAARTIAVSILERGTTTFGYVALGSGEIV
jgi:hypothetical protein